MYVTQLVAPETVNTMPEPTLDAVADHGQVSGATGAAGYDDARTLFQQLSAQGVDMNDVVGVLESEGVQKFEDSWAQLLETVDKQLKAN